MSSSHQPEAHVKPLGRGRVVKLVIFLVTLGVVVAFLISRGIQSRVQASVEVQKETDQFAVPAVTVVHPQPSKPADELVLTGALQAYSDAPIYARASGYVKQWDANIGDRVKSGQVLAELEAPEMDLQYNQAQANLQQARAALSQAEANLLQARANENTAKITADRWGELVKQGIVSSQDNDTRQGQYQALVANRQALEQAINAAHANIASQQANIAVLDQLRSYRTVRAPFDGVVTARRTDIGALVTAGSNPNAQELFHVAATDRLRVYVSIPELYSRAAVPGLKAALTLEEFPNRKFQARLVRTNGALDSTTRTLLCEFEVDNPSETLRPGSYAEVHLDLPAPARTLTVPVSAVMFRPEGSQVGIVGADGKAKLVTVALGKDYGTSMEVLSGLQESDQVIESPPDSLTTGTQVRLVRTTGE